MTKKLTEQWSAGTLKTGSYYIRILTGNEKSDYFDGKKFCFWTDYEVEEVLGPVPSYNEVKRLQEQLDEAKTENNNLLNDIVDLNLTIQHKEEQLKEANDIILKLGKWTYVASDGEPIKISKYLKKWGVK